MSSYAALTGTCKININTNKLFFERLLNEFSRRMTKMAKPGLTKILADIQEQVSSDDECIAHNKKIKSIR